MGIVSYAQNYEDVMLWRALGHVDQGVYVDVGANDPTVDSVTRAFYEAGWRGVNIEPVSEWHDKLVEHRPEDINLRLACGARKGNTRFFEVVGTGLSTMDESIARSHAETGKFEIKESVVPVVRLHAVLEENLDNKIIHFLKIDVEGAELQVLRGANLKQNRPWILLVESTLPNTQVESYQQWEDRVVEAGYHFVYFDGLNRFYVADEHMELDDSFTVPPNFFDFFVPAKQLQLQSRVDELIEQKSVVEMEFGDVREQMHELNLRAIEKETHVQELIREISAQDANAKLEMVRLEGELTASKSDLLESQRKLMSAEREAAELSERLERGNARLESEIVRLEREAFTHLKSLSQVESELESEREEAASLRQLIEQKTNQIRWLNEKIRELDMKLDASLDEQVAAQSKSKIQMLRIQELNSEIAQRDEMIAERDEAVRWLESEWRNAETQSQTQFNSIQRLEWKSQLLSEELDALHKSTSWRITFPLRLTKLSILALLRVPKRSSKWISVGIMKFVMQRPALAEFFLRLLKRAPRLFHRLRNLAYAEGVLGDDLVSATTQSKLEDQDTDAGPASKRVALRGYAEDIFWDLRSRLLSRGVDIS